MGRQNMLWLGIPEEIVKANYERDTIPDPSIYYMSKAKRTNTWALSGKNLQG